VGTYAFGGGGEFSFKAYSRVARAVPLPYAEGLRICCEFTPIGGLWKSSVLQAGQMEVVGFLKRYCRAFKVGYFHNYSMIFGSLAWNAPMRPRKKKRPADWTDGGCGISEEVLLGF
jgi:hypothetical protein